MLSRLGSYHGGLIAEVYTLFVLYVLGIQSNEDCLMCDSYQEELIADVYTPLAFYVLGRQSLVRFRARTMEDQRSCVYTSMVANYVSRSLYGRAPLSWLARLFRSSGAWSGCSSGR